MHLRGSTPAMAMILAGVLLLGGALWWIGQNRTHPPAFDAAPPTAAGNSLPVVPGSPTRVAPPASTSDSAAPTGRPAARPSPTVGSTGPGLAAPGLTAPGLAAPGLTGPGLTGPGLTAPGLTAPGSTRPVARSAGAPTEVAVPALGVRAPVDPVLNQGGVLRPPDDPTRLGWWIGSALPGAGRGSVVIAGHVDSAQRGPGALFRLAELPAGGEISVLAAGGAPVTYRVTARQFYAKSQGLPPELFSFDGPPRLVLITCGGEFDETAGSYAENVVVTAEPV